MEENNIFYDEIINKLNIMQLAIEDVQSDPSDEEKLNELFRSIHTVKSIANILFFLDIEAITHKAEDLLGAIREHRINFTPEIIELFLELKKFLMILVDEKLEGLEMDDYEQEQYENFEKQILKLMPQVILVLDYSYDLKEKIEQIANQYNVKVVTASNALDADELLKTNNIALFMINIHDENTRGLQFIDFVYTQTKNNAPLVLIANQKDEKLIECGRDYKAKAWFLHGCNDSQIDAILKKFILSKN
jgi:chemotaxis protein histidine kinase CheA